MASAEQLKALLKSHIEGDEGRFLSIAMQVAAHEAKLGHGKLAEELRDMIDADAVIFHSWTVIGAASYRLNLWGRLLELEQALSRSANSSHCG